MSKAEWLDERFLRDTFRYCGASDGEEFTIWSRMAKRQFGQQRFGQLHGHFRDRFGGKHPGHDDALAARRAILTMKHDAAVEILFLLRDEDGKQDRRTGLSQAREEQNQADDPMPIVIGLARPDRESWVLSGFQADSDDERACCDALRRKWGFDPCANPSRLPPKGASKQVLFDLTQGNSDREERCWSESSFDDLLARGADNGLADYLAEIDQFLLPAIAGRTGPTSP